MGLTPLKSIVKKISWAFGFDGFNVYPYCFVKDLSNQPAIDHEKRHCFQQDSFYKYGWYFGILVYRFLYFLCLPICWNPFRYKWEMDAYVNGSHYKKSIAHTVVCRDYWLWFHN